MTNLQINSKELLPKGVCRFGIICNSMLARKGDGIQIIVYHVY